MFSAIFFFSAPSALLRLSVKPYSQCTQNLYLTLSLVGNLSWGTQGDDLFQHFSSFGQVNDAIVLKDRETGRSRGFGFVTFSQPSEADAAVQAMDGQDLDGRQIRVNLANDRR